MKNLMTEEMKEVAARMLADYDEMDLGDSLEEAYERFGKPIDVLQMDFKSGVIRKVISWGLAEYSAYKDADGVSLFVGDVTMSSSFTALNDHHGSIILTFDDEKLVSKEGYGLDGTRKR